VILINLLPHREERRNRRKITFFSVSGAVAFVSISFVVLWYLFMQQLISVQENRNLFLQAKISELDMQIKDVKNLQAEIDKLRARQKAVESLQSDRNLPVNILSDLIKQTPDGVYLSTVIQEGRSLKISGLAQSNERVSEFLRNTNNSEWFSKPDLISIDASSTKPPGLTPYQRDSIRFLDFSMQIGIKQSMASKPSQKPDAASSPSSSQSKV
jgi:type IV pilus assembly protein PilN